MELIILESGGMTSFVFHCVLIIFFGFVLYNIYFNPKGPYLDIFERNTLDPLDAVFKLIADDILKLKN